MNGLKILHQRVSILSQFPRLKKKIKKSNESRKILGRKIPVRRLVLYEISVQFRGHLIIRLPRSQSRPKQKIHSPVDSNLLTFLSAPCFLLPNKVKMKIDSTERSLFNIQTLKYRLNDREVKQAGNGIGRRPV